MKIMSTLEVSGPRPSPNFNTSISTREKPESFSSTILFLLNYYVTTILLLRYYYFTIILLVRRLLFQLSLGFILLELVLLFVFILGTSIRRISAISTVITYYSDSTSAEREMEAAPSSDPICKFKYEFQYGFASHTSANPIQEADEMFSEYLKFYARQQDLRGMARRSRLLNLEGISKELKCCSPIVSSVLVESPDKKVCGEGRRGGICVHRSPGR